VLALGATTADSRSIVDEVAAAVGGGDDTARVQVRASDVVEAEQAHGAGTEALGDVAVAVGSKLPPGVDPWFPSGTPLSLPIDDDSRTEAAWDIWQRIRDAAGAREARGGKTVIAYGSRLLAHLPNLMRLDPCMSVAVRLPGTADADGGALIAALSDAAPVDGTSAAAAQYLSDWAAAANRFQSVYARRVFVGDGAAAKASQSV